MVRYCAFVSSDEWASHTAGEVIAEERQPIATGLVDASGAPLYRIPEAVSLGFHAKPRVRVPARSRRL